MVKRRAEDAAITRSRIMAAAQDLFMAQGFAGTTTSAIAAAADVTQGALFHHFKDKTSLFREIVVKLQTEVHQAIWDAAAKATTAIEGFRLGALESMRVTQVPVYQRIVFTEAPAVLGR